jgi:nitroreductase
MKAIYERRSIRFYSPQPIPRPLLTALIEAGNMAPSGHNQQPWRFVVVEDSEVKQTLLRITLPLDQAMLQRLYATDPTRAAAIQQVIDQHPDDPIYYSAPVILFIIGTGAGTESLDCPLVCQNIMLAAHSVGLGSCIVGAGRRGLTEDPDIINALKLTANETIYPPIVLGYPITRPKPPTKQAPHITWI